MESSMDIEIAYQTDAMLHQAVKSINVLFGDGYAEQYPELVGSFMVAASNNNVAGAINYLAQEFERKFFTE
jgi:hypothetical protein